MDEVQFVECPGKFEYFDGPGCWKEVSESDVEAGKFEYSDGCWKEVSESDVEAGSCYDTPYETAEREAAIQDYDQEEDSNGDDMISEGGPVLPNCS